MPLDADSIVDRRRLRRKLTFWRVVAVLVAVVAIGALGFFAISGRGVLGSGNYIARVQIQGLIRGDQSRVEALDRLARSSSVAAVIVHLDTPGGTTAGSEQLYDALRRVEARKPVVAVVDGMAASGGYIAAIAADHIVSQQTALVGSIGVLFQFPNFTETLKTLGITVESIKSSPLKAAPSGLEPTTPEAREAVAALIRDSFDWFKALVKDRRGMDDAQLAKVADGRVFTGRQAVDLKLIDALGDERTARAWLEKQKNISASTPVRDYSLRPRFDQFSFLHVMSLALSAVGLETVANRLETWAAGAAFERLNLDGLLALWHPSLAN